MMSFSLNLLCLRAVVQCLKMIQPPKRLRAFRHKRCHFRQPTLSLKTDKIIVGKIRIFKPMANIYLNR